MRLIKKKKLDMRYNYLIFMIIENSQLQANSKYMIHQRDELTHL